MASAEHFKSLLRHYLDGDEAALYSTAMQVAAHEAKLGHSRLARELRELIDQAKSKGTLAPESAEQPVPISRPRGELASLLTADHPKTQIVDMVLTEDLREALERVVTEQRRFSHIASYGLRPRARILFTGPPGTGKTMSAESLAGELRLPLFRVNMEALFTKFLGETASKLRLVFNQIEQVRGVYLFDEFDSIGSHRHSPYDVGEMTRVVNAFLHLVESTRGQSLILAATNSRVALDKALFRRFDDVITYGLPEQEQVRALLNRQVPNLISRKSKLKELTDLSHGLSFAEISTACAEANKDMILEGKTAVNSESLARHLRRRREINQL